MVYSSPISDHGATHLRKVFSYHWTLMARIPKRVTIAAPSGIPRKTATLVATVWYETEVELLAPLMTLTNRIASGA